MVSRDSWLERWLPLIESKAAQRPVLELGFGSGRDTQILVQAGCKVVGVDLSEHAVASARDRFPCCEFFCQDVRASLPSSADGVNVVLASLCLHYFAWDETVAIIQRISQALSACGLLLCRLNSTDDHNFGARGYSEIDYHYYLVNGSPKRFFDRADIERLLAEAGGWHILHCEHRLVDRYSLPKALWEVAVGRQA